MKRILLVLAAILAPMAAAAEPLEVLENGLPVAAVTVGESGPYRFIIDTAASNTNLLPTFIAQAPRAQLRRSTREISGAAGKVEVEVVTLDTLTVAERTHTGLEAFELPPSPIDALGVHGILGADVITRYVLDLDVPRRRWSLDEQVSAAALSGMFSPISIWLDDAKAPRLTVLIDGVEIPAVVDTGARGTILNWQAARQLGLSADHPAVSHQGAAQGATSGATPLVKATLKELQIGEFRRASPVLNIGDLPIFEVLGLSKGPGMILGMDQLGDRRVILDFPLNRLLIERR